tara:strand:- start:3469 stop:3681 length:213 start_codon:yes stop_codon:yes gene_type:complete
MGMLLILKEGKISKQLESGIGGINFVSSFPDGFKPADGGASISLAFRVITSSISVTNNTSSKARAIVIGV